MSILALFWISHPFFSDFGQAKAFADMKDFCFSAMSTICRQIDYVGARVA